MNAYRLEAGLTACIFEILLEASRMMSIAAERGVKVDDHVKSVGMNEGLHIVTEEPNRQAFFVRLPRPGTPESCQPR